MGRQKKIRRDVEGKGGRGEMCNELKNKEKRQKSKSVKSSFKRRRHRRGKHVAASKEDKKAYGCKKKKEIKGKEEKAQQNS